jgi:AraC family transcriptional regulator
LPDLAKVDYVARINRAIDHVVQHLDEPLDLEQLAGVACFSPFHFHRVFKSLVGETVASFVKRVRLERAIQLMSHRPDARLTDIALACGFASSSDFSRSFKQRYGVPPRAFDVAGFRDGNREHGLGIARLPEGENPDGFVATLHDLAPRFVAYVRVTDSYRPGAVKDAAQRMIAWARRRGLAGGRWLGYMWDDPEVVPLEKCRYDLGVEIPARIAADGEVGCLELPAMKVARVEVRGGAELELRAIDWVFRTWLPPSGFVPADQPCFEAFHGMPFGHGDEYFELDAEFPVVRASPL